jgi:serine/threonine protein kinase
MSKLLGEGSYGCIYSPTLKCKNKDIYNKNYVSKALLKEDSNIEKHHIDFIKSIDPTFKYHFKTDNECVIEDNKLNHQSIKKCSVFKNNDYKNIKLLVMENGGLNLEEYSMKIKTRNQSILFWLKIQNTIKAINIYLKNNVVHNDLKAQNILFNEETQKIGIIDFGLMHSMTTKKNASKNYYLYKINEKINILKNKETLFINETHYSWPLENEFIEKRRFIKYIKNISFDKHKNRIENIIDNLKTIYKLKDQKKIEDMLLKEDKLLDTIYTLITEIIIKTPYSSYNIFNDYLMNIYIIQTEYNNSKNKEQYYNNFLEDHLNTTDIYGLGIAYIQSLTLQKHLLPDKLVDDLYNLFYKMITPIIKNRLKINELLESYEKIMNNHIKEYNLQFINHILIPIKLNN